VLAAEISSSIKLAIATDKTDPAGAPSRKKAQIIFPGC
jgi:hypothetical protein